MSGLVRRHALTDVNLPTCVKLYGDFILPQFKVSFPRLDSFMYLFYI